MRKVLLLLGFCALCSILPMHALRADEVRPLYQLSDDRMLSDQGRHRAMPAFSTGAGSSVNFFSWRVGHVSPMIMPTSVSTSSRVQLYTIGTNDLPSETPLTIRRVHEGDTWEDYIPGGGQGNPENLPVGSSAVLVLFAWAYAAYIVYKKRLSHTNR